MSDECDTSTDAASSVNDSCSNVAGLDTVCSASNSLTNGCFSQSRSSPSQADRLASACESLRHPVAQHNAADLRSKPSVDVPLPQPLSTTVSDSANACRSVDCALY